jgi:uncharacterized protein (TIGR03435 family)
MKHLTATILLVLVCLGASGQPADRPPSFEVASVKPAPPDPMDSHSGWMKGGPGSADPTHFTSTNMSLATLLMRAFGIKRFQLSGPSWLDTEYYNVAANIPEGATPEQFQLMLQNLLVERFKLTLHHQEKEMPIYELVVGKSGPKLKEAGAKDARPEAAPAPPVGAAGYGKDRDGYPVFQPGETGTKVADSHARMHYAPMTMEQLAVELSGHVGRTVKDATGLEGRYDISLRWVPERPPEDPSGPTLFSAIQDQLGLKLDAKKGSVDTLVLDHVERVPAEN